jgi:hypothetical protein
VSKDNASAAPSSLVSRHYDVERAGPAPASGRTAKQAAPGRAKSATSASLTGLQRTEPPSAQQQQPPPRFATATQAQPRPSQADNAGHCQVCAAVLHPRDDSCAVCGFKVRGQIFFFFNYFFLYIKNPSYF